MLSLFCGFPQGHNGNSACSASNTHMLPDASESQKQELRALQVLVPPPHTAWLQNMQTDRASLDSPVCVPASDASPQVQTKSVNPAHNTSCGLIQGSVYVNSATDAQTFACARRTQPKYLHCSHSAAIVNTQRNNPPALHEVIHTNCGCLTPLHILDYTLKKRRHFGF